MCPSCCIYETLIRVADADWSVTMRWRAMNYQASPNAGAPAPASTYRIALSELLSPVVVRGVAYWQSLRGTRRFPPRHALSTKDMVPFLRHVALIQVLDGGADYRFRLVGDAHVEARGYDFAGETIAEMRASAPLFADRSYALYEYVRTTGEPYALRGAMTANGADWRITYRECVFLPLGPTDALVDFLFVIGTYALQAYAGHDVQADGAGHTR